MYVGSIPLSPAEEISNHMEDFLPKIPLKSPKVDVSFQPKTIFPILSHNHEIKALEKESKHLIYEIIAPNTSSITKITNNFLRKLQFLLTNNAFNTQRMMSFLFQHSRI